MSLKAFISSFFVLLLSSCATAFLAPEKDPKPEIDLAHIAIPLEGVYNLRDMGGYPTQNGRKVKYGLAYRADDLHTLTEDDLRTLEGLKIKSIIDFRSKTESQKAPDRKPKTVKNIYEFPIDPVLSPKTYSDLVVKAQDPYRSFFEILSDQDDLPVLFHCTAGEDRTGFAAALFLSALGVDRETIYNEYLLSGRYIKNKDADQHAVRRDYLEAAFRKIDDTYGSVDDYLIKHLYVDLKLLRSIYTTR